jgi:hypothetical protein
MTHASDTRKMRLQISVSLPTHVCLNGPYNIDNLTWNIYFLFSLPIISIGKSYNAS